MRKKLFLSLTFLMSGYACASGADSVHSLTASEYEESYTTITDKPGTGSDAVVGPKKKKTRKFRVPAHSRTTLTDERGSDSEDSEDNKILKDKYRDLLVKYLALKQETVNSLTEKLQAMNAQLAELQDAAPTH